jgi:glycosyltransferase involved in cell wall biosynthesis
MVYPPHIIGGAERSVALLAKAQLALGHDVAVACTTPGEGATETIDGVPVYRMPHQTDFWAEEWPQHGSVSRVMRRVKIPYNRGLERSFEKVLDEVRPDVLHTHSLTDVSTRVWLAAARKQVPIAHTLRDYDLMCSISSMFKNGRRCKGVHLRCQAMNFPKRAHHKHVGAVAGVGAEILNTHLQHGYFARVPESLRHVIWNAAVVEGVDANYHKPERSAEPFTFGYLGRINIEKGVGTLIEAARQLPKGNWQIVIAGKAVSEADLRAFRTSADGLPIHFLGFIEPKAFFDQIDTLVVPSIWPEPLPRTILEAYAADVPALGARSGGIPDLIGHDNDEWLFVPGDVASLTGRLSAILAAGRQALPGRDSFSRVLEKTQPEMVAQNYLDLYSQLLRTEE